MATKSMKLRPLSLPEKLLVNHEKVTESGCWIWQGEITRNGYGRVVHRGQRMLAHRAAYETFCGPIPDGLTIDHLCRVRPCINPSHLEAVTTRVNTLRGTGVTAENAKKTHCKRGHALTEDNLYSQGKDGRARMCRTCNLEAAQRRYIATRHVSKPRKYT